MFQTKAGLVEVLDRTGVDRLAMDVASGADLGPGVPHPTAHRAPPADTQDEGTGRARGPGPHVSSQSARVSNRPQRLPGTAAGRLILEDDAHPSGSGRGDGDHHQQHHGVSVFED